MLSHLILTMTTAPILQLGRLRFREGEFPAQGHTASLQQSQDWNPDLLPAEAWFLVPPTGSS